MCVLVEGSTQKATYVGEIVTFQKLVFNLNGVSIKKKEKEIIRLYSTVILNMPMSDTFSYPLPLLNLFFFFEDKHLTLIIYYF